MTSIVANLFGVSMRTAAVGILLATSFCQVCDAIDNDWPQFGGPHLDFRIQDTTNDGVIKVQPGLRWKRSLGDGMSSLAIRDQTVYASFLRSFDETEIEQPPHVSTHREVIIALDGETGETIWDYEYDAGFYQEQEAFGGRTRAPQATPLVTDDFVINIGFSGLAHCLDRHDGQLRWRKDLVKQFAATPVQFGFSSSPIMHDKNLIVLAGGSRGGLVAINIQDGEVAWNLPCQEASYATPTPFTVNGHAQIVFVTRNNVVGVDPELGQELWRYRLPTQGLTNVPTPLVVGDNQLVISGQGIGGTRLLEIQQTKSGWKVQEGWFNRVQFFYCNWLVRKDFVIGCEGNLLVAIHRKSGQTIGRWRGFGDSNLLMVNDQLLIFSGRGDLVSLEPTSNGFLVASRHKLFNQRCWTPPALVDHRLYCRGGSEIACVEITAGDHLPKLPNRRIRQQELKFGGEVDEPRPSSKSNVQSNPGDSVDKSTARAEQSIQLGNNGLRYVSFALLNSSSTPMQYYVKGPSEHPFSYGFPMPAGGVRGEKWPVDSQVYRTDHGKGRKLVLTVGEAYAGKTIDLIDPSKTSSRLDR